MNNHITNFMLNDKQERHIKSQSKRLAAYFIERLKISANEYNLVYAIGSGNERTNREALEYWIHRRLTCCSPTHDLTQTELISALENELENQFSSI